MYLSKLEIRGFKSFKNKEVLEFPQGFSAIIGPNGSGKTNVVDAICFVLGSSRNLRVKRLEELICNGGTKGEKAKSAKVSLYLKEENTNKRRKISREVDQEGKSSYQLDGKKVLREEILDLVGDNEYNILHQNDVTRLVDMKPVQRREVIDDLCGLREYEEKKEKAMKELEKVEEKFSQTNLVLGEKRGYLEGLKGERDEALRYNEINDKLKRCKGTIIKHNLGKEREKEEKIEREITTLQKGKTELLLEIKKIKDKINEKSKKVKELNQKILKLEESKGNEEILQLREERVRGEGEVEHQKKELQSLERDILDKRNKRKEILEGKKALPEELAKVQAQLAKIKPQLETLGKNVKGLGVENEIQELSSNLKWLKNALDRKLVEEEELEKRKKEGEKRLEDFRSQQKTFSREYEKSKEREEKIASSLEKERDNLKKITWEKKEIEPALESLQGELAQKKAELNSLRKSPSRGAVARAIMSIAPIVKGIYGTAQELGTPDHRYEKALTVASEGRIYAIGVKDEETAKKCIQYLRKRKIGRATFLPLNTLKVKLRDKPPQGSIGFARNFITCQEKFKPIFRWILRDTLLVNDLDAAKKIGIGKWSMVTLEGDIISTAGAISGGYVKVKQVFSTEGEIKKEISLLEKKIVHLNGKREDKGVIEEKIRQNTLGLEENLQGEETHKEKLKVNLNSLQEKVSDWEKEVKNYQESLEKIKKEIKRDNEGVKREEGELKNKEKEYQGSNKKEMAEKLKQLEEKYHQLSMEDNSLQEKNKFLSQRESELESEIKLLLKKKKEAEGREEQTREKVFEIKKKLEKKRSQEKGVEDKVKELLDSKEKLDGKITSVGEEVGKRKYELESMNEKLNRYMVKKARVEIRISDLEKGFKEYQNVEFMERKIPELEKMEEELGREIAGYGFINMRAIENYKLVKEELDEMKKKVETLKKEKQSIFNFMEKVERRKSEIFMEAFTEVRKNFEEIFKELGGGKGTLRLDHVSDLSRAGLIIKASPGGKKLISLDMMSGGEKVLTCSAFLLAVQRYKPSYFHILDELDASLDKRNSLKLAEMLKSSSAQFILVTHNDTILKYTRSVIGISMQDGLSQVVGVKLKG